MTANTVDDEQSSRRKAGITPAAKPLRADVLLAQVALVDDESKLGDWDRRSSKKTPCKLAGGAAHAQA
jgi:hypothetical protein